MNEAHRWLVVILFLKSANFEIDLDEMRLLRKWEVDVLRLYYGKSFKGNTLFALPIILVFCALASHY